jgi:hypothetical protein
MTIGYQITKTNLDNVMGSEIGGLWNALLVVHTRKLWLDDSAHNLAFMNTLSYTNPEDASIRAAFTDMDNLWKLSHATAGGLGVAAVGSTAALSDFFFNAKLLSGTNWYG